MKNTYLFNILLLCMPTLFGAAIDGSTSQEMEAVSGNHVTLQTKDGGNENIPLLAARTYSGLLKDLTAQYKSEPIKIKLADAYSKTTLQTITNLIRSRSRYTTAEQLYNNQLKDLPATTVDSIFELIKLSDYLDLDDVIMGALGQLLKRDHKFDATIRDFLHGLAAQTEKIIAAQMINPYFLKLSTKKENRKPELLPHWLREHFTGVSIQNLLDYGVELPIAKNGTWLDLSEMYINNLTGLKNIPHIENIELLTLLRNLITAIEPGVFASLPQLQELYLTTNRITTIEPNTFAGLPRLRGLCLSANYIRTIRPNAFADLAQLDRLYLAGNQITTIELTTFAGLSQLKELDLSDNYITTIAPGAFDNLSQLQVLRLYQNPILRSHEEYERIEEEVGIATNDRCQIIWGKP